MTTYKEPEQIVKAPPHNIVLQEFGSHLLFCDWMHDYNIYKGPLTTTNGLWCWEQIGIVVMEIKVTSCTFQI